MKTLKFPFSKRVTRKVTVGNIGIGGNNPIRIQSMITSDTRDTESCMKEIRELANAGCELIRLTAQTRVYAESLQFIREAVDKEGINVPLVADIHFKPDAAFEASKWMDKVRINPGNFADKKKFLQRDYTDKEYNEEIERLYSAFSPLVLECKKRGRAMRIGVNHGSLSDRIMNRYGDTPNGMVESAIEFASIARDNNFHNFVFSMKSSNPKVMIHAYRLLASRLEKEGKDWNYPIHLGVTEAGSGTDGRIKSAIGIGSLLYDGIGDTIRVSLTEDPVREIPVAKKIVKMVSFLHDYLAKEKFELPFSPFSFERRATDQICIREKKMGATSPISIICKEEDIIALNSTNELKDDLLPDFSFKDIKEKNIILPLNKSNLNPIDQQRIQALSKSSSKPIVLSDVYIDQINSKDFDNEEKIILSSIILGTLLCDGIGDAVFVRSLDSPKDNIILAWDILQASGARITRTDYVACPSCGRTLFDLQSTTKEIKKATSHLKGVRIAIMGCIVNGPGEMADADFGYVGGSPGKINLYVGKKAVQFHIPQEKAVASLIDLIKSHCKWTEPS